MPSTTQLAQTLIDGVMVGSLYALIALAFSMLWASIRTVNLGLLQVLAVGGVTTAVLAERGGAVAIVGGIAVATAVGVTSHVVAIRPTLRHWGLVTIIASLGAGLAIQGILIAIATERTRIMPSVLPSGVFEVGDLFVRRTGLLVVLFASALLALALVVTRWTRIGLAFRSSSWAPDIAAAHGVSVERVRMTSAVGSSVAIAAAGVFLGLLSGSVSPFMGTSSGFKGVMAMFIGGAGNLTGAVVGGLALGVIEAYTELFVSSAMKSVLSFALILVIMIARPQGLMRER